MLTTNDRIALALAACEGITNDELKQRGTGGFKKMIQRKRHYAAAARTVTQAALQLQEQVKTTSTKLAQAQATMAELQALDVSDLKAGDTSEAAGMLAAISSKKAGE